MWNIAAANPIHQTQIIDKTRIVTPATGSPLLFGFDGVDSTGQLHKAPTTNARVSPSTLDDVTGNEADYYDNLYALRGRFTVASVSFVVCGWYRDTPGMCAVSIMGSYLQ